VRWDIQSKIWSKILILCQTNLRLVNIQKPILTIWLKFGFRLKTKTMVEDKVIQCNLTTTRMWANAQRDGRPAEHRWRSLFNAAKFG